MVCKERCRTNQTYLSLVSPGPCSSHLRGKRFPKPRETQSFLKVDGDAAWTGLPEHLCPALDYLTWFCKHSFKQLGKENRTKPSFLQDLPEADNVGTWAMGKTVYVLSFT